MSRPYHAVNVLVGTKQAKILEDGRSCGLLIQKAKRPLLVLGSRILLEVVGEKPILEYALAFSTATDTPICATAHTKKKLLEAGCAPACSWDLVEITNSLKQKSWNGVRGEGNHDLVLFMGIRSDLLESCLSTLKHFAPHLKTVAIDRVYFPNADYSTPNFQRDEKLRTFLEECLESLKTK